MSLPSLSFTVCVYVFDSHLVSMKLVWHWLNTIGFQLCHTVRIHDIKMINMTQWIRCIATNRKYNTTTTIKATIITTKCRIKSPLGESSSLQNILILLIKICCCRHITDAIHETSHAELFIIQFIQYKYIYVCVVYIYV